MKLYPLIYLISASAISFLLWFFLANSGYRLPVYYTPEGHISIYSNQNFSQWGRKIKEIQNEPPNRYPIISIFDNTVMLKTDTGLHQTLVIKNNFWKIVNELKFFIIASFIFCFTSIWIFKNSRDFYLVTVNILFSLFFLTYVILLSANDILLIWQVITLILSVALLNLGLRTTGYILYSHLAICEVIFVLFFALICYVGKEESKAIEKFNNFLLATATTTSIIVLYLQIKHALKKTNDRIEKRKRFILFLGTGIGLLIPLLALVAIHFPSLYSPKLKYIFWLVLVFPISLIYATYRLQLVPFQIFISNSVLGFIQSAIFASIYGLAIFIEDALLPEIDKTSRVWISHILLIFLIVFLFEPIRYFINTRLKFRQYWEDPKYEASIEKMISQVTSHYNIQVIVEILFEEVQNILKVQKIDLLLSENILANLKLRKSNINRISLQSTHWKYLKKNNIIATDYFTYASGTPKELYNFLFKNNYILAIGTINHQEKDDLLSLAKISIKKLNLFSNTNLARFLQKLFFFFIFIINKLRLFFIKTILFQKKESLLVPFEEKRKQILKFNVAIAVGSKKNNTSLKLDEIRYLTKASKLLSILFENYTNLIFEIEKRQRIRELQVAGQLQKRLPEMEKTQISNIQYAISSKPALNVSGDYFDLFKIKKNWIACILADVSGHGLGTGYLASSLRAILRTNLISNGNLFESVNMVNKFFMNRYKGDEFVTLVAFLINTKSGEVEYINAAHPAPLIIKKKSNEHIYLNSFSPILGVLPVEIYTKKIQLENGDRLFIFSDGVTETFNKNYEAFGEKELYDTLSQSKNKNLNDIISLIENKLLTHRANSKINDDTTMALLEFTKSRGLFDFFQ